MPATTEGPEEADAREYGATPALDDRARLCNRRHSNNANLLGRVTARANAILPFGRAPNRPPDNGVQSQTAEQSQAVGEEKELALQTAVLQALPGESAKAGPASENGAARNGLHTIDELDSRALGRLQGTQDAEEAPVADANAGQVRHSDGFGLPQVFGPYDGLAIA